MIKKFARTIINSAATALVLGAAVYFLHAPQEVHWTRHQHAYAAIAVAFAVFAGCTVIGTAINISRAMSPQSPQRSRTRRPQRPRQYQDV